jgi:hypothetical protein
MLRCNTAQAAEDGPPKVERSAGEKICPLMELGADPKHNLQSICDPPLRAARFVKRYGRLR